MASVFDEKILGERQKIALAQKLRESGQEILQGRMVGDRFVGPSWTQGLAQALKQGLGAYQESQAENKIKDLNKKHIIGNIQTLGAMGIPATPAMLDEAGTPAEAAPIWDRWRGALGLIPEPQGTPAQPYQQTVAKNPTAEDKRNAMLQYQINNDGDLSKLGLSSRTLRPEYTIGPDGVKYVTPMSDPYHATPMTTPDGKPVRATLYDPTGIGKRTQAVQRNTPIRVKTLSGETIMSGTNALGGDGIPSVDDDGGILHYDSENDTYAYVYDDGTFREVE